MKIYKYFIFIFIILLTWNCSEEIYLELDEGETKIVIEGALSSTARNQLVKISKTSAYYDSVPMEPVTGATVTILDSAFEYTFTQIRSGLYISTISFAGIPGKEYKLKVETGNQIYEATSTMPRMPSIDSIRFYADDQDAQLFHIGLFAQENPLTGDYYSWGVYKDYLNQTKNLTQLNYMSDELINGSYFNGNKVQVVNAKPGNRITLQMASISKEYFNFVVATLKETVYNDGVFKPAPANIKGNISNGALGFFITYTETFKTKIIQIEE